MDLMGQGGLGAAVEQRQRYPLCLHLNLELQNLKLHGLLQSDLVSALLVQLNNALVVRLSGSVQLLMRLCHAISLTSGCLQ